MPLAQDDTQRYGLLKDDALIILCTDFKIGVYIYKSFLHIPDIWERHLAATAHRPHHSEWSEAESNCEVAPNEVRWNLGRTGINRKAVMRRSEA